MNRTVAVTLGVVISGTLSFMVAFLLIDDTAKGKVTECQQLLNRSKELSNECNAQLSNVKTTYITELSSYANTVVSLKQQLIEVRENLTIAIAKQQAEEKPIVVATAKVMPVSIKKPSMTCDPSDYTFRKTCWGMSKDDILNIENLEIIENKINSITFTTEISKMDTHLIYFFDEDKLYKAGYKFQRTHTNSASYITDHMTLKLLLEEKYGKAEGDGLIWIGDPYEHIDLAGLATAVSNGSLTFRDRWSTGNTDIILNTSGYNYAVSTIIIYHDKKMIDSINNKETKITLSDL